MDVQHCADFRPQPQDVGVIQILFGWVVLAPRLPLIGLEIDDD